MKFLFGLFFLVLLGEGALAQGMEFRPIVREGYASFAETSAPVQLAQQRAEYAAFKWCSEALQIDSAFRLEEWSYKAKLDANMKEIGYFAESKFSCVPSKPVRPKPPITPEKECSKKSRPYGPYCYWDEDHCQCDF
ncbi:hypothetical protein [Bdellovibrio bacteriovorus]|uniref:hypothetical protein n=1 Tax=Bdellovibrio TaxID=958 RepID=UPI0035A9AA75